MRLVFLYSCENDVQNTRASDWKTDNKGWTGRKQ